MVLIECLSIDVRDAQQPYSPLHRKCDGQNIVVAAVYNLAHPLASDGLNANASINPDLRYGLAKLNSPALKS
jgi:hypothetical protein